MEAIRGIGFFVLYWMCSLIRVSVIRGSTVYDFMCSLFFFI
jgi:hypothetical protein